MGLTPKETLLAGDTNQASVFFPYIRLKWVNNTDWSAKLYLTKCSSKVDH